MRAFPFGLVVSILDIFPIVAVVELIAATTTEASLKVESALDPRTRQKGIKVNDAEIESLDIVGDQFHPEWN